MLGSAEDSAKGTSVGRTIHRGSSNSDGRAEAFNNHSPISKIVLRYNYGRLGRRYIRNAQIMILPGASHSMRTRQKFSLDTLSYTHLVTRL